MEVGVGVIVGVGVGVEMHTLSLHDLPLESNGTLQPQSNDPEMELSKTRREVKEKE